VKDPRNSTENKKIELVILNARDNIMINIRTFMWGECDKPTFLEKYKNDILELQKLSGDLNGLRIPPTVKQIFYVEFPLQKIMKPKVNLFFNLFLVYKTNRAKII
jgi:hypothetical protein